MRRAGKVLMGVACVAGLFGCGNGSETAGEAESAAVKPDAAAFASEVREIDGVLFLIGKSDEEITSEGEQVCDAARSGRDGRPPSEVLLTAYHLDQLATDPMGRWAATAILALCSDLRDRIADAQAGVLQGAPPLPTRVKFALDETCSVNVSDGVPYALAIYEIEFVGGSGWRFARSPVVSGDDGLALQEGAVTTEPLLLKGLGPGESASTRAIWLNRADTQQWYLLPLDEEFRATSDDGGRCEQPGEGVWTAT